MKRTVIEMLRSAAQQFDKKPYTCDKTNDGWSCKSFGDVWNESQDFAASLITLGYKKDDKIAILSEGRSGWVTTEFGLLKAGCISVPLSIKLLPEEILFRLNHSESKAIIASKNTFEKIASIWSKIQHGGFKIFFIDNDLKEQQQLCKENGIDQAKDILLVKDLLEKGKKCSAKIVDARDKINDQIDESDTVTICYTSGTTGNPKGIMLTHLNYFSNSWDAQLTFNMQGELKTLIILPLDHSFAHTIGTYIALILGINIYFVDARGGGINALKNIPLNLKEVAPDFLLTVPALTGNFMRKITEGINAKGGFIKWLFNKGLNAGIIINGDGFIKAPTCVRLFKMPIYKIANALIFKKLRNIFGGTLQFCVGGGALLDIRQQKFFYAIGTPVLQGYGLTEATPIISTNTITCHKLGSSGIVIKNIDLKILRANGTECKTGEKGEIVIRGNNVMKGYFKNEAATKKAIKDGWLFTGDMGYIDADDFLIVVGREKALLISQDGEKYSPEEIEEAIMNCSELINQALIHNDQRRFTSALITLDDAQIRKIIKQKSIKTPEALLEVINKSLNLYKKAKEFSGKFPDKWMPTTFRIVDEAFSEQNKMINSTLKMVRFKITETYKVLIEEMYLRAGTKYNCVHNIEIAKKYF